MIKKYFPYVFIFLGCFTFLLDYVFSKSPWLYENLYFGIIFPSIRFIYDYTLGFLPFPSVYLLFVFLIWMIYRWGRFILFSSPDNKLRQVLLSLGAFVGGIIFFFYFLWGHNYNQKTFSNTLELPDVQVDSIALYKHTIDLIDEMRNVRSQILQDSISFTHDDIPDDLEKQIRNNLVKVLDDWKWPTPGRARVRVLYPKGLLLRISTAGVYIPFVNEGHIDAGLHPIQYPFTMAHEMSHGYGITDEGACNFVGFVACYHSDNPVIKYSGMYGLWRYMARNLRTASPSLYLSMMMEVSHGLRIDYLNIITEIDKYPDILPDLRDVVYDNYLKSHGVKGGLVNYNTVVEMYIAWKASMDEEESKSMEKRDE